MASNHQRISETTRFKSYGVKHKQKSQCDLAYSDLCAISFSCSMYSEVPEVTAWESTSMRTAPVKAIALPAVYRATWVSIACALSHYTLCGGLCTSLHSLASGVSHLVVKMGSYLYALYMTSYCICAHWHFPLSRLGELFPLAKDAPLSPSILSVPISHCSHASVVAVMVPLQCGICKASI